MTTSTDDKTGVTPHIVKGFGDFPPEALVDKKIVSKQFGRCETSVDRAVSRGELPPPIKILGKNRWLVSKLLEHFREMHAQAKKKADEERKRLSEYME